MKGKGTTSRFMLTLLMSTDYFHYNFTYLSFAACFLPLTAYHSQEIRPYGIGEMKKKMEDIRNHRFGGYYNFAQKGLGNIPMYQEDITFDFFFKRLEWCDKNIESVSGASSRIYREGIESENLRKDLLTIIKTPRLYWKENIEVTGESKERLLEDLAQYSNRYVIAEILWGIVSGHYRLPDVEREKKEFLRKTFGRDDIFSPNAHLDMRGNLDDEAGVFFERLSKFEVIKMLFLSGGTFGGGRFYAHAKTREFSSTLLENGNVRRIEIVMSKQGSEANRNESRVMVRPESHSIPAEVFSEKGLDEVIRLKEKYPGKLIVKTTEIYLPYAVLIAESSDGDRDFAKIDLYSPFTKLSERPSIYVFRQENQVMFDHFRTVFHKVWQDDVSQFA